MFSAYTVYNYAVDVHCARRSDGLDSVGFCRSRHQFLKIILCSAECCDFWRQNVQMMKIAMNVTKRNESREQDHQSRVEFTYNHRLYIYTVMSIRMRKYLVLGIEAGMRSRRMSLRTPMILVSVRKQRNARFIDWLD